MTSQKISPPTGIPEWRQPLAPEMGRVEAPSTQPYRAPEGFEDYPEMVRPEGMEVEETVLTRIRHDPPER